MNPDLKLKNFMKSAKQRVDRALDEWLPPTNRVPHRLHEAMRYSVLNGGKRMRPILCYATGQALGVRADLLNGAACSVELIHAYSLVHDDLPAMDDDDLRRGKATCHVAFDEATAILV
ncbi:MAG: polyprenyl synthetase family protein, partial [Methylococcales bacterium]